MPEAPQEVVPAKRAPFKERERPSVEGTSDHALKAKEEIALVVLKIFCCS